jgi:DNA-binding PadR family transcriptional regulator
MLIPLYILGLLIRVGPQHGYQIKKMFEDQLSDFTQIKLPTIYYHLEKMEKEGLLAASSEKNRKGQDKTIYSITGKGKSSFYQLLNEFLPFKYQPTFASDAVFYFSSQIDSSLILQNLKKHVINMQEALNTISEHKMKELQALPEEARKMALVIFSHHERHYQAELDWAQETLAGLEPQRKGKTYEQK